MKKIKWETKGWAIINWEKSAIINDGEGQKQIYRTKEFAEDRAKELGYGTSIIKVKIVSDGENNEKHLKYYGGV